VVIAELLRDLAGAAGPDELHRQAVVQRAASVLRPPGAFARLDRVAGWLAAWQRTDTPAVAKPALVLAAADHGVVARGVSAFGAEVTTAMIDAIGRAPRRLRCWPRGSAWHCDSSTPAWDSRPRTS
jgi:NaMN:DMB phosphoribosyltransferase